MPIRGRPVATNSLERVAQAGAQVEREHVAGAERVAVREAARHRDQTGVAEQLGPLDELVGPHHRGVGARQLERDGEIAVAVRAGPGHDHRGDGGHAPAPTRLKASTR